MKIIVISLPQYIERRKSIKHELSKLNKEYTIINGIDGSHITENTYYHNKNRTN